MNHDELAFVAEMSKTNQAVAVYLGRVLDVDGGRTEFSTSLADVERLLADRLFAIAQALQANAIGRNDGTSVPTLITNGTTENRP